MNWKNKIGYTLIESLFSIMLLITLLTLSAAAYQYLIARNKTTVYLNTLVTTIHYARSEALKRHLPVTVCKSNNGRQCNGQWRDGWLIFVDPHNKIQPENLEQIVRVYQALPAGDQLIWRASLHKNDFLQFNALGNLRQAGTFIYCPQRHQQYAGAIVISLTGRVRVEKEGLDKTVCKEIG
jgi:type IV fimbrial biogenesis protein FimT